MPLLRTLWFLVRLGVLIAAIGWLAMLEGRIQLDAFGYEVSAAMGPVLACLLVACLILWFVIRIIGWVLSLPGKVKRSLTVRGQDAGMRAVMTGLSAMAAGDGKTLRKSAKLVPQIAANDHGLSLFMTAMADRMDGKHEQADAAFARLMAKPDTAFLGMRALYQRADQGGERARALTLARQAHNLHPKQARVIAMRYREEVRAREWENAKTLLSRLVRMKQITKEQAASDRAAMALAQISDGENGEARLQHIRAALKASPGHLPATLIWIEALIEQGKGAEAARAVEKAWKQSPHPDLAGFWLRVIPKKSQRTQKSRLRWVRRLASLAPNLGHSHLLLARFFMNEGLLDQANEALNDAERSGGVEAPMLRLRAELAEAKGEGEAQIRHYLNAAAEVLDEEGWVCRETGRQYREWAPFAAPHHAFNSIIWGKSSGEPLKDASSPLPLLG